MSFIECLKISVEAILAHKLRSFLTLLGMIISVTSFMTVLSALLGFNNFVEQQLSRIGTYTYEIQRFSFDDFQTESSIDLAQKQNKYLKLSELNFIRKNAELTVDIGAKVSPSIAEVKRKKYKLSDVKVFGAESNIATIEDFEIKEGRFFTNAEDKTRSRVAYIGSEVAKELFPYSSPVNKRIYIKNMPFRVIGVQEAEGDVFESDRDTFITIPFNTYSVVFGRVFIDTGLSFVGSAESERYFDAAVQEVRDLLRAKRKLTINKRDNFGIVTPEESREMRRNMINSIFIVVLIVPIITLVVGAIVIMNTMLVTVVERKNEIGLRRAFGATRYQIILQFIMESIILASIGGMIGVGVASLLRLIIDFYGFPTSLPLWAIFLAIFTSGLVGLLAGVIPANQAANLDPIEAIQAE